MSVLGSPPVRRMGQHALRVPLAEKGPDAQPPKDNEGEQAYASGTEMSCHPNARPAREPSERAILL